MSILDLDRTKAVCRYVSIVLIAGLLAGCATQKADLPVGQPAYDLFPSDLSDIRSQDYRLAPDDKIAVWVFQEPDLSRELTIQGNGTVSVPLVGQIAAQGRTLTQLESEISARLRERFLVSPDVTVSIVSSPSRRFTIDGAVETPGLYPISTRTTLLDAVASAEGLSRIADPSEVLVFREIGGERYGAKFDLGAIRRGEQPVPEIIPGDVVIVGGSQSRQRYQDLIALSPLLGSVFVALLQLN